MSRYLAIITDATTNRQLTDIGAISNGTLTASTWTEEIPLADGDMVIVPSRENIRSVQVVRGTGADIIGFPHITSIERVIGLNTVYSSGYTLVNDAIVWAVGKGPAIGERYSVRVKYNPLYEVDQGSVTLRGFGLPQRCQLQLIDEPQPGV